MGGRAGVWLPIALLLVVSACGTPAPQSGSPSSSGTGTTGVSPSSAPSPAQPTAWWTTYHRDPSRTGYDSSEPDVGRVAEDWRTGLDGQIYAEPLVYDDKVLAATEADTVYALDASTGKVIWSTDLGTPVPGGSLPCGNIDPSGITGTPVVDAADGDVWVVDFVMPGVHQLVSLGLADGKVRSRQAISLPDVNGLAEQQRGALALASGNVYIPFGGLYGDCGDYKGFVVGFPTNGTGRQFTFAVPTTKGGAVWSPGGPVVGANGDLLVSTGNSASTTTYDDGNAVLRLSPALVAEDFFAPTNWSALNHGDLDLGSLSPTPVGNGELFQVGKQGVGYLLSESHLGGVGGQLYTGRVCASQAFGATARVGSVVLVPCRNGLVELQIGPGDAFSTLWTASTLVPGPPIVAGGRVWDVTLAGHLVALDIHSGAVLLDVAVGKSRSSFPSLSSAGGRLFVPAGTSLIAFGGV